MPAMVKRSALWLVLVALVFTAWPLWSGWQLRQAMKARDVAALEARVDWPLLRANLKLKLAEAVRADAERSTGVSGVLKRTVGGVIADKTVDLAVTPKTLARVLAGREFVLSRQKPTSAPPTRGDDLEDPDDPVPPRRLRWAFFESPSRFRFEATHPRLPNQRIVAVLGLSGLGWTLVDVDLVAR
jgi:hypothetical protein